MDPQTVKIQGDLSRADVVSLCQLCTGKEVIEYGMGGSTLILSRCARSLSSFEESEYWCDVTRDRLYQIPDKTCQPATNIGSGVEHYLPKCDVLWIDGTPASRIGWITNFFHCARTIVIHDARRGGDVARALEALVPFFEHIKTIHINYNESNLLVVEKREQPLVWENWNVTEKDDNRVSPFIRDYVE